MDKKEFVDRLRAALNGRVSPSLVMENVNYYEDYINTEIRKGRSEEEVLASLGDPRLIARTIVETNGQTGDAAVDGEYQEAGGSSRYGTWEQENNSAHHIIRIPGWVWLIIVLLALVLVLGAVFSVLSFLMPILLPIVLIIFLVKLFRDWLN